MSPASRDLFEPAKPDGVSPASSTNRGDDPLDTQPLDHERAIRRSVDQEKQDRRLLREQNIEPADDKGDDPREQRRRDSKADQ